MGIISLHLWRILNWYNITLPIAPQSLWRNSRLEKDQQNTQSEGFHTGFSIKTRKRCWTWFSPKRWGRGWEQIRQEYRRNIYSKYLTLDSNTGIEIELPITVLKNSKACFLVPQMRARIPNASCYLLLQPLWHCYTLGNLTIPMLRLLSSEGRKDFWKTSKPWHVGIHKIALAKYS